MKYVREYERPSICRLSVRLPVPLPPKADHRGTSAFSGAANQPPNWLLPPLSISQPVQFNEKLGCHAHTYETIHTDLPRLSITIQDSLATFARLERVFPQSRGRVLRGNLGQRYGNLVLAVGLENPRFLPPFSALRT